MKFEEIKNELALIEASVKRRKMDLQTLLQECVDDEISILKIRGVIGGGRPEEEGQPVFPKHWDMRTSEDRKEV